MKKILALGLVFAPMFAFAQSGLVLGSERNLGGVVGLLKEVMNVAMGLILAAAVVVFVWGAFKFVMAAGDEEGRKEGRDKIIYGLIGIAVIVSVYGLVAILTGTFGGTNTPPPLAPQI